MIDQQVVTLVIPPSAFLLDERVFPSLGILKVASVLEAVGIAVAVLDLSGIENYEDVVALHAQRGHSSVYGITATTPQMPATARIANQIRSLCPDARIIIGGPHPTLVAAAIRSAPQGENRRARIALEQLFNIADVVVSGDGEKAIFSALEPGARGLIDADVKAHGMFLSSGELAQLPYPARHLIDLSTYHYCIDGVKATSMIAQLGCPFTCGFCGGRRSPMLRHIRTRPAALVVEEMKHLSKDLGYQGMMLYDDELNVNKEFLSLLQAMREAQDALGVDWKLRGFIKAELFTDEQARAMRAAGFEWILVGFESGSPRILRNINKRALLDQNTRCMEISERHGLKVKALMSVGHPGESPETLDDTLSWLLHVRPADFDVTVITCYPGTPYYDEAVLHSEQPEIWKYIFEPTGDILFQIPVDYMTEADYYKGDPEGGYRAYVFTEQLSPNQLVLGRNTIERVVREKLKIAFNPHVSSRRFEHSMGMHGADLPASILRLTNVKAVP